MSTSFYTVFASDAHLAKGQLYREESTVNKGKSQKFLE
jgi:hypothetical protein